MPELRFYRLFISHAWIHNDDYYKLVDMLNKAHNFEWHNYSVPEHDPLLVKTPCGLKLTQQLESS